MARVLFFFDITCPYAYLASTQVEALCARNGAELVWRPMLLGGVFRALAAPQSPGEGMSPPKARMNFLDMHRWADWFGVPFAMPAGHPRRSVSAMRLLVALPPGQRAGLAHALFRAYWVTGEDIADPAVLLEVASRAGVTPQAAERTLADPAIKEALRRDTDDALAHGVFGAPAFWVEPAGMLFWGQDRLAFVERALGGWRPPSG